MTSKKLSSCIEYFDSSHHILVITHIEPDGDAIGSCAAMGLASRQKKKLITCVCADSVPRVFHFIPGAEFIQSLEQFQPKTMIWDLIVTIDCGDIKRTGYPDIIQHYAKAKRLVNIDHHQKSDLQKAATLHLGDESVAATSQILVDVFQAWNVTISKDIATCLLTGLYTDTGGFKHTNTTTKTLNTAARLLEKGARVEKISRRLLNNKSVSALKLWGVILKRMKTHKTHAIVSSVVTQQDLAECRSTLEDISGAVNLMNTVPESRIALLLIETAEGALKASLRTEDNLVDVGKIAAWLGGGGHRKASGFTIPGRLVLDNNRWKVELN